MINATLQKQTWELFVSASDRYEDEPESKHASLSVCVTAARKVMK